MTQERKSTRVNARVPAAVMARVDFVIRNTDGEVKNRSIALRVALEEWLPKQEQRLEQLGVLPKKTR